jgi:hypothetical protein
VLSCDRWADISVDTDAMEARQVTMDGRRRGDDDAVRKKGPEGPIAVRNHRRSLMGKAELQKSL